MNCLLLWAPLSLWLFRNDKMLPIYATSLLIQSYTCPKHIWTLNSPLYIAFSLWKKKFNVILLTLQYHLVQTMPFHLTIAILLSASMQSLQTMPVLNASRHWPILQWQTILASLSQTTPILQFHSSSSKIPFFPKFMVFSNLLSSSNPLAMNPPFSGQHVCCTSPFFSRLQTIH